MTLDKIVAATVFVLAGLATEAFKRYVPLEKRYMKKLLPTIPPMVGTVVHLALVWAGLPCVVPGSAGIVGFGLGCFMLTAHQTGKRSKVKREIDLSSMKSGT